MRVYTYISADWDSDKNIVERLRQLNNYYYSPIKFKDVHEIKHAYDSSLNCSIKKSLGERIALSKRFVLIVGDKTKDVRAGSCSLCSSYHSWTHTCRRFHNVDYRSYIDYECELALDHHLPIIALYNSYKCDTDLLPKPLQNISGIFHVPFYTLPYYGAEHFPQVWTENIHELAQYLCD